MTTNGRPLWLLLPLVVSAVGCGDDTGSTGGGGAAPSACEGLPDDCDGRTALTVDDNAAALAVNATALAEQMASACRDAAVHFGVDPSAVPAGAPLEERLGWCDRASAAIDAVMPPVQVAYDTLCTVDLAAQAACESACTDAPDACTPDVFDIPESRCGQDLAGTCQGQCAGTCWPDPGTTINCNAACVGDCNGTCNGAPSSGPCAGGCAGSCDGSCAAPSESMVLCQGTCAGACDVAWVSPSCTDVVTSVGPGQCVTCDACNAQCRARGVFGIQCRAAASVSGPPPADAAALRALFEAVAATGASLERITEGAQILTSGLGGCCTSGSAAECAQEASTSIDASLALLGKVATAVTVVQL